jgi:uncharacterized protein YkwD
VPNWIVRFFAWLAGIDAGAVTPGRPPAPPPPPQKPANQPDLDLVRAELARAVTNARNTAGQVGLILRADLSEAAQVHSDWMARNRRLDHHEDPGPAYDFAGRLKQQGYGPLRTGGENVAAGQRTSEQVMADWMASPGHRANILDQHAWHVGFGCSRADDGNLYWCAVFAAPLNVSPRGRFVARVWLPEAVVRRDG